MSFIRDDVFVSEQAIEFVSKSIDMRLCIVLAVFSCLCIQ